MLKQNGQLLEAANIYSSYPIDPSNYANLKEENGIENSKKFDDAFIFGELVLILINEKNYDDARLSKYLILWAKIMGIGLLITT
jgi:hypothetical protein